MWLDVELGLNTDQLARMVGFEVMARVASKAFPQRLELMDEETIRLVVDSATKGVPAAKRDAFNEAIESVVAECLGRVFTFQCSTTTKFFAALSTIEARLSLRQDSVGAVVIDSLSALHWVWQAHEAHRGAECHRFVQNAVERIRSSFGVVVLMARVEHGQVAQVDAAAMDAAVAELEPGCAACLYLRRAPPPSASDADLPRLSSLTPLEHPIGSASSSQASDLADHIEASLESTSRASEVARRVLPAGRQPPDAPLSNWDKRVTHRVKLARVVSAGTGDPFEALSTHRFCARLLKAPGKTLPFRQLWPYSITGAGLVECLG